MAGEVEDRIVNFDQDIFRYDTHSGEKASVAIRIGIASRPFAESAFSSHLLVRAGRLPPRPAFKVQRNLSRCALSN